MSLFFVNCERTVLFSVKRDLDLPPAPLPLPPSSMMAAHGLRAVAQLGFIPRVLSSLGNNLEDLGKEIVVGEEPLSPNFNVRHKSRGDLLVSKGAHHQRKS